MVPRVRIELTTLASSKAKLDYIIILRILRRSWALVQDYCWDSPASLYTFSANFGPAEVGSGLFGYIKPSFPRIHPVYHFALLRKAPKYLGQRSTNELPRHNCFVLFNTVVGDTGVEPVTSSV